MSSVGSINSNSSLWYWLYTQNAAATGQVPSVPGVPSATAQTASSSDATSAAAGASGSTSNFGDLRTQIETAVNNALSNLDPSSSPSDVLQAVHGAIDSTLQANGVNPQQFRPHGHHHHHAESSQNSASSSSTGDADGDALTSTTDNSTSTPESNASQPQDLLAILLEIGTQGNQTNSGGTNSGNPSSQQNTLASAIGASTSSTGGIDLNSLFAQLFANFPAGSGLNVQA